MLLLAILQRFFYALEADLETADFSVMIEMAAPTEQMLSGS